MTAPPRRRERPGSEARATSTPPSAAPQSTAPGAAEVELMRGITDNVDRGLWMDLMNGRFRLAMRCERCGRWLTAHKSKAAGIGPVCSGKAAEQ